MAAPVKPPGTPAPAASSSPPIPPAKPPADAPGTVVVIKDFTSPFRRIQQTERLDDTFACIAMVGASP